MDDAAVKALLDRLDGNGSADEWAAAEELGRLGADLATWLLGRFRAARSWKVRCACVYHATRYARESDDAVTIGTEGIRDRSKVVRYRASMLLAYAQRKDTLPALRDAVGALPERPPKEDLLAAIDAIESGNHHYFIDRDHTGMIKLEIGPRTEEKEMDPGRVDLHRRVKRPVRP
jgi:hypothetical protein